MDHYKFPLQHTVIMVPCLLNSIGAVQVLRQTKWPNTAPPVADTFKRALVWTGASHFCGNGHPRLASPYSRTALNARATGHSTLPVLYIYVVFHHDLQGSRGRMLVMTIFVLQWLTISLAVFKASYIYMWMDYLVIDSLITWSITTLDIDVQYQNFILESLRFPHCILSAGSNIQCIYFTLW